MINLLPQEQQKEISAASANTLLLRYLILLICAMIFLLGALGVTYFSLDASARQADATKEQNERAAVGYQETQTAANTLRSELSSAKTLFDKEIRYSKILLHLSSLLPEGTSISEFSLDSETFSQPVTLSVRIGGKEQAQLLEKNFKGSPYVTNASLGNIKVSDDGSEYIADLVFTFTRSAAQ